MDDGRAEAERCLAIAEKLLVVRDLVGSKDFAVRAHLHDPLVDGVDRILAVADVLLAAENRVDSLMDWYAILQLNPRSHDLLDSIKKHYRRLARLLHPDKNRSPGSVDAFRLVVDAWAVLSDPAKRAIYDKELHISLNRKKSTHHSTNSKPTSKIHRNVENPDCRIWVSCPYCCNLYEYAKDYENCKLRCQNCRRGFHAVAIPSPPPVVPGMDAYYCSWGFFPLGIWDTPNSHVGPSVPASSKSGENAGFPSWKPFVPMFAGGFQKDETRTEQREDFANVPNWNGDWEAATEVGNREQRGAAGVRERFNSPEMPKGFANEEPLLVMPISMRPPKKKKVVKNVGKQTSPNSRRERR